MCWSWNVSKTVNHSKYGICWFRNASHAVIYNICWSWNIANAANYNICWSWNASNAVNYSICWSWKVSTASRYQLQYFKRTRGPRDQSHTRTEPHLCKTKTWTQLRQSRTILAVTKTYHIPITALYNPYIRKPAIPAISPYNPYIPKPSTLLRATLRSKM